MATKISRCYHVRNVGNITRKDLLFQKDKPCLVCGYKGKNKWICLKENCLYVGCGVKHEDHAGKHSSEHNHELQINIKSGRIWCNVCECEIFPHNNIPSWEEGENLLDRKSSLCVASSSSQLNPSTPLSKSSLAAIVEADKKRQSVVPYPSYEKISVADESKSRNAANVLTVEHEPKKPSVKMANYFSAGRLYRDREHPTVEADHYAENLKDFQAPGLVGLRNLGNTCYMNAALQALSNCPPLTEYMLNCRLPVDPKYRCLATIYQKIMSDMWSQTKRPPCIIPYEILQAVRSIYPLFRGFQQQDAQEFLRCFLDALHEDVKQPVYEWECQEDDELKRGRVSTEKDSSTSAAGSSPDEENFRTCDSGWSSDRESFKTRTRGDHSSKLRRRAVKSECEQPLVTKSDSSEFSEAQTEFSMAVDIPTAVPSRRLVKRRTAVRCSPERVPKKRPIRYRSIVSDVFDGRLLSAVQCLTCDTVSETRETFQDLSLSIPTKDQLEMLKNSRRSLNSTTGSQTPSSSSATNSSGWFSWTYSWIKNWACGPSVSLEDCLAAFFSADDLKGDDMYSCDRCKKLRNGVKFCSLLRLPEILCIHLKRFRHEMVYSSKISTFISFPLENLNLTPFVSKSCKDEVQSYDLVAVICHRGGVEGGHYTAYCMNPFNFRWYEFDDQYATEVDVATVQSAEAYVLFYRKCSDKIDRLRQEVAKNLDTNQTSLMKFYISREWIHRFNTFAEPGSITNFDFLCPHGWISPSKAEYLSELNAEIPDKVWHILYKHFGGGPVCSQLRHCFECQQQRQRLMLRRRAEYAAFTKLQKEMRFSSAPEFIYALSIKWYRKWEDFVLDREEEPPGPVNNGDIAAKRTTKTDPVRITAGAHFVQITKDMWEFFHTNYGGGPEILLSSHPSSVMNLRSMLKTDDNSVGDAKCDAIVGNTDAQVTPCDNQDCSKMDAEDTVVDDETVSSVEHL